MISTIISKESGKNRIAYDCRNQHGKLTGKQLEAGREAQNDEAQNDILDQTAADLVSPVNQSEHGDPWKSKDIELLKQKHSEYGDNWEKIMKHFPLRRKDVVKKY
jgi:hypothetical protein